MMQRRPDRVLGQPHDIFWDWCEKGELHFQRCSDCAHLLWPVMKACDRCGATDLPWERVSGQGRIVSWCSFVQDYYKGMMPVPYDTILVELDEGPLFISNPLDLPAEAMKVGMPVEVAFMDCEDKAGSFRLPVFTAMK